MRICIIVMITQTIDKLTPIEVGFPMKAPVHQGPEQLTPKRVTSPCTP
jgi:hypothetical protein